jgi:hypothetical protein
MHYLPPNSKKGRSFLAGERISSLDFQQKIWKGRNSQEKGFH